MRGAIVSRATDEDARVRTIVAHWLHLFPRGKSREVLRSLLDDPTEDVRLNAILSLGVLGEESVIPKLESLLKHESAQVRVESQKMLDRLRAASSSTSSP